MATYFRFVEPAETELDEAIAYYEAEASMGAAFAAEVERVLELALQFPESGTSCLRGACGVRSASFA